jgi:hypothetical protein
MAKLRVDSMFDPSQGREVDVDNPNTTCREFVVSKGLVPLSVGEEFNVFDNLGNVIDVEPIGK